MNASIGEDLWHDAQNDEQRVASWRGAAVLAYTSGSAIGHVCTVVAAMLVTRYAMGEKRWGALRAALLAGAVFGLTGLGLAFLVASPRLRRLSSAPQLSNEDGYSPIDPGLGQHAPVLVAIVLALVTYMAASVVGVAVARCDRAAFKALLIVGIIVPVLVLHYKMTTGLVPEPGPY